MVSQCSQGAQPRLSQSPALSVAYLGSAPLPHAAPCCCCRGRSSASWWGDTVQGTPPPLSHSSAPHSLQGKGTSIRTSLRTVPRHLLPSPARSHPSNRRRLPGHPGTHTWHKALPGWISMGHGGCFAPVFSNATQSPSEKPQNHLETGLAWPQHRVSRLSQGQPRSGHCPCQPPTSPQPADTTISPEPLGGCSPLSPRGLKPVTAQSIMGFSCSSSDSLGPVVNVFPDRLRAT